jgi:predicted ATPase/class 3 adenylate cyclase
MSLPAGTVTFVFTDIEGSTHLLQELGDAYPDVLEAHNELIAVAFTAAGGRLFGSQGDALFAVFSEPAGAVAGALEAQRALRSHPWDGHEVRVRMGVHTGDAVVRGGTYIGLDVHRVARICSAAHGGQVLVSEATAIRAAGRLREGAGLLDLGPHRLKDLPEPDQLFELTHPDLEGGAGRLRSDAVPGNLPKQVNTFVGRRQEVADAHDRLRAGKALLTLVGPGGCGKTRLALEVAAEVVDAYPDGAWVVELASVNEPDLVVPAIAATLEVRDEPGVGLEAALAGFLRTRRLLLVLDNCEHLVESCARVVADLIRACPGLQVLATSQEALAVAGEHVVSVPPLALGESVQLFADRASARAPGFALDGGSAAAVSQICRRLEGIPLAIELAAARVNVLTPSQIAARLDDQFRLLTGGDRAALPRQRTLRATVEWSHGLLTSTEQMLLRRLAVFAGGWTLDAAEAVCAREAEDDTLRAREVLDLLGRLVARSLVVVEEQDGAARYRLLEPIRQYATERLFDAGEAADIRSRHLQEFAALTLEAEPELTGADQAAWLTRLAAEADNLRAAMEWSASHPAGGELLLSMATSLWRFWLVRGHWAEGRAWLARALDANEPRTSSRARALAAAGDLATEDGLYEEAHQLLGESLALWRELDDTEGIAKTLNHLGNLARARYETDAARAMLQQGLEMRRAAGNDRGVAVSLRNLGLLATQQRDFETARTLFEEAVPLARAAGDKRVIATLTHALATVTFSDGDWDEARRLAEEALQMSRQLGDRQGVAEALTVLSGVSAAEGDGPAATSLLAEADAGWQALASRDGKTWTRTVLGEMALSAGDYGDAAQHLDEALRRRHRGDPGALARLTNVCGWAWFLVGDLDTAEPLLTEAIELARVAGDDAQLSVALHNLADLIRTRGDVGHATRLYDHSLELARATGWRRLLWWPLHGLGVVARLRGEFEEAAELLRQSLLIRPRIGRAAGAAACLEELALVAGATERWTEAARLFGHAAALRVECRASIPPVRRAEFDEAIRAVRAVLGPTAYELAAKEGELLSPEDVANLRD